MNTQGFWFQAVEDYLTNRRSLGFTLDREGNQLRRFAQFAEQTAPTQKFTQKLAESWAHQARQVVPITLARRIEGLRGFANFLKRRDPETEIPPSGLFGPAHRRRVPHIFSDDELAKLLEATHHLPPPSGLRSVTCRILLGLLAATGLRIGEAVQLTCADVDLTQGILTIREAKRHSCRRVPVHETVRRELRAYQEQRDLRIPTPKSDRFFLLDNGQSITARQVRYAFLYLVQQLAWTPRGDYSRHRLHDLRHTFIVHSLLASYRQNIDVARAVVALSTYVGHAKLSDTYWYVRGVPELMAIAANRFHRFAAERAP